MSSPVDAGGLSEQSRVPAQVDDIIVLTEVLPRNPENTCRENNTLVRTQHGTVYTLPSMQTDR